MRDRILHGLIQKALRDANDLHARERVDKTGALWRLGFLGWRKIGQFADPRDAEDFLVSKLTQEDR